MAKIRKICTAGPLTIESIYTAYSPRDGFVARAEKKKLSSDAQQWQNLKNAYQKLEFQLAANIRPGDWAMCLTYRPERRPRDRAAAQKDITAFLRKLRARRGGDWCYFYRLEHKHKNGTNYHFHLYLTSGPETGDDIHRLWGNGEIEYIKKIAITSEQTYERLARYMVKEHPDKLGHHLWEHSRGLKKPEIDRIWLPDDADISVPPGCVLLDEVAGSRSIYGSYHSIKFMALPNPEDAELSHRS